MSKQFKIMKTQINYLLKLVALSLILFLCFTSCEDKKMINEITQSNSTRVSFADGTIPDGIDSINYESEGKLIYNHLKNHLANYDPYELMPKAGRSALKAKFDSLKAIPSSTNGEHWDEFLRRNQISKELHGFLKENDIIFKKSISNGAEKLETERWFNDKIVEIKLSKRLSTIDKHIAVRYLTLVKYSIKSYFEALTQQKGVSGGRMASGSCSLQQVNCAANTIATYAGIGSVFEGAGGAVGAVVGVLVSFFSCPCEENPCQFPIYVGTPDVCYNQYYGLKLEVAGYGNQGFNGFRYEVYKSDNLTQANQLAVHASNYASTTFSDSELQGYSLVYVLVASNCGSGSLYYQPSATSINISNLGHPQFAMTGSTNAQINSYQVYDLIGRNITNTTWHIYTYGPTTGNFVNLYSNSATVQWNANAGFVHITADASTDCGTYTDGLYVTTHN